MEKISVQTGSDYIDNCLKEATSNFMVNPSCRFLTYSEMFFDVMFYKEKG